MKTKQTSAKKAATTRRDLKKNLIFAAVILLLALTLLGYAAWTRANGSVVVLKYGTDTTERIPLSKDGTYQYNTGDYVVTVVVRDGSAAFTDSKCPDHICESFGWLSEDGAWAICMPAGAWLQIEK